jgi:CBS domain-containing protein
MRYSLMDSDPTRAAPPSAPAATTEVTPSTPVGTARQALVESGARAAVVMCATGPAGVVTRDALRNGPAARRPGAIVADVMDYEVVRVAPTAGTETTLGAFTRAAWRSLLRRDPFRQGPGPRRPSVTAIPGPPVAGHRSPVTGHRPPGRRALGRDGAGQAG